MKKETKKQIETENLAIDAVNNYLKARGWKPLIGGFVGIEQTGLKYNFRLIFNFTGKPPKYLKV